MTRLIPVDGSASAAEESSLVQRAINRPLSNRLNSATADVKRIIDATYSVLQRTGTVDPTMRDILKEAELSTQAFYRYFASKDELMLAILDDGRRRLADYLDHRLAQHDTGAERVAAWVTGLFAQARDESASRRTRPFITNRYRLMEQHPTEIAASVNSVSTILEVVVAQAAAEAGIAPPSHQDVVSAYHLTISRMEIHIVLGTRPEQDEVVATIGFIFRALGLGEPPTLPSTA